MGGVLCCGSFVRSEQPCLGLPGINQVQGGACFALGTRGGGNGGILFAKCFTSLVSQPKEAML